MTTTYEFTITDERDDVIESGTGFYTPIGALQAAECAAFRRTEHVTLTVSDDSDVDLAECHYDPARKVVWLVTPEGQKVLALGGARRVG